MMTLSGSRWPPAGPNCWSRRPPITRGRLARSCSARLSRPEPPEPPPTLVENGRHTDYGSPTQKLLTCRILQYLKYRSRTSGHPWSLRIPAHYEQTRACNKGDGAFSFCCLRRPRAARCLSWCAPPSQVVGDQDSSSAESDPAATRTVDDARAQLSVFDPIVAKERARGRARDLAVSQQSRGPATLPEAARIQRLSSGLARDIVNAGGKPAAAEGSAVQFWHRMLTANRPQSVRAGSDDDVLRLPTVEDAEQLRCLAALAGLGVSVECSVPGCTLQGLWGKTKLGRAGPASFTALELEVTETEMWNASAVHAGCSPDSWESAYRWVAQAVPRVNHPGAVGRRYKECIRVVIAHSFGMAHKIGAGNPTADACLRLICDAAAAEVAQFPARVHAHAVDNGLIGRGIEGMQFTKISGELTQVPLAQIASKAPGVEQE